jgi:hypothetical protein
MLHAIEAPLFKLALVAGAALAASTAMRPARVHAPVTHRLSLQAPVQPNALYLTAWAEGDVKVTGELQAMTFTTRAYVNDGCRWMGIEKLEPIDARHFSYTYDETILSCDPDSVPYFKTPRTGIVTVEE